MTRYPNNLMMSACSVMTSSQKMLEKMERKDKRRTAARGGDPDLDWLGAHGFDEVVEAEVHPSSLNMQYLLALGAGA